MQQIPLSFYSFSESEAPTEVLSAASTLLSLSPVHWILSWDKAASTSLKLALPLNMIMKIGGYLMSKIYLFLVTSLVS